MDVKIYRSISEIDRTKWDAIVPKDRIICSHKYVELIEKAGVNEGRRYYVVVYDGAEIVAHTFAYLMNTELDLLAQGPLKKAINLVRRVRKDFFVLRYLECGSPAEVGNVMSVKGDADRAKAMRMLCNGIEGLAKELGVKFLVLRDFYNEEAEFHDTLKKFGYIKAHNLPKAEIRIKWKTFDEYLSSMRSSYRCKITKSMKKCSDANVKIRVLREFSSNARELKRLYDNTSGRAKEIKREPFTEAFFQNLDKYLGDRSILVLAEKDSRPIGFMLLLINHKELIPTVIGLDYDCHQECCTYFNLFYKTIELAIEMKMDRIDMGITTLDPKRDMGSDVVALNMYMKHYNPVFHKTIPVLFDMITPPDTTQPRNVFKDSNSGFTLLETMVTVAIVSLLAAMAIPNFVTAKTQAHGRTCIANLKQIESAKSVWALNNNQPDTVIPTWEHLVPDYIKHQPACPSNGTYTIADLNTSPSCTTTNHALD